MSSDSETQKDPDEGKTIPDQLYKIAEESEGGAAQVMDQVEISINNFEEIKGLAMGIMEAMRNQDEESIDMILAKADDIISYAENGLQNLDGILDLYQYQDITRQKLEKIGHQLIDVSEYIRQKLVPDVTQLAHIPPSGKDILDRDIDDHDGRANKVDDIIAEFLKNKV